MKPGTRNQGQLTAHNGCFWQSLADSRRKHGNDFGMQCGVYTDLMGLYVLSILAQVALSPQQMVCA